jgi:hypothetical protein
VNIRHLPHIFNREALLEMLDSNGFRGQYDFVYLPLHYRALLAYGNSIVNFTTPMAAQKAYAHFQGYSFPDGKHAVCNWATSQGLEQLVDDYRNTPVMHEVVPDVCRPAVFKGSDLLRFPPPTKKVQKPRSLRNADQATPSQPCRNKSRPSPLVRTPGFQAPPALHNTSSPLYQGLELEQMSPKRSGHHSSKASQGSGSTRSSHRRQAETVRCAPKGSLLSAGLEMWDDEEHLRQPGHPAVAPHRQASQRAAVFPSWTNQYPSAPTASPLFQGLQLVDPKQSPNWLSNAIPWPTNQKAQAKMFSRDDDAVSTVAPSSSSLSSFKTSSTKSEYLQAWDFRHGLPTCSRASHR